MVKNGLSRWWKVGAKRAVFALGLVASWLNELYFARGRFPSAGKVEALGSGGSATPHPPGPLLGRNRALHGSRATPQFVCVPLRWGDRHCTLVQLRSRSGKNTASSQRTSSRHADKRCWTRTSTVSVTYKQGAHQQRHRLQTRWNPRPHPPNPRQAALCTELLCFA